MATTRSQSQDGRRVVLQERLCQVDSGPGIEVAVDCIGGNLTPKARPQAPGRSADGSQARGLHEPQIAVVPVVAGNGDNS